MPTQPTERAGETSMRQKLAEIVGAKYVLGGEGHRKSQRRRKRRERTAERRTSDLSAADCSIDGVIPTAVVSPGSEEEISEILRLANERDYVVVPAGGMTKRSIGAPPERFDILLRTDRLNRVLHYDAGDLTLGVGAGMTISEVQKTLAANSQFLPLDPVLSNKATIGGVLASNASGPMRSGYGGVRDYCIGVNFVTGDGKAAKGGGKVVKNVAGYDLMKLMIGSMGTLGVITSANFKVFPCPQQTCTFACECPDLVAAIKLRDRVIATSLTPMCLEIISPRALEYLQETEVRDPDHYAPLAGMQSSKPWQLLLRATGSDAVLRRYRNELGGAVTHEVSGNDESELWRRLSDFEETVASRHMISMVVNVNVNIASVMQAYQAAEQSAVEHNLLHACVGRAGVGSLVFAFMPLGVDPPSAMQFASVASSFRGRLPKGASAVVVRCPREAKNHFDLWGSSPNDLALMRGLRNALDPKKVLNRGRFIV